MDSNNEKEKEEAQQSDKQFPTQSVTHFYGEVKAPVHTGSGNINAFYSGVSLAALWEMVGRFLCWQEASDHARSSWAGMAIWSFSVLVERFNPVNLLKFVVTILLWVMAAWLVTPLLNWPLVDAAARFSAATYYAAGSLLLPLVIALLTQADGQAQMQLETGKDSLILLLLKLSGAYVGFQALLGLLWLPVLALYYLSIKVPVAVWQILVIIPLLFSYISARRIPADRVKMYGARPQLHPVDKLFLPTFILFSPFLAGFIYLWYEFLANRIFGLVLLFLFVGILLWEQKKGASNVLSDLTVILLLGFLLPLASLSLLIIFIEGPPSNLIEDLLTILVLEHFIGMSLLWVTLWLRNKPVLTLKGLGGLLLTLMGLIVVLLINLTLGQWLTIGLIVLWLLWGRKHFRSHLWIHPSFALMLILLTGSLYLAGQTIVPVWVHIAGLAVLILLLVGWGYQSASAEEK